MQFILEHQAHFVAEIQELKERDAFLEKQIQDLAQAQFRQLETVNHVVDVVERLGQRVDQWAGRMDQLAAAQQRTEENLNRTEENLNALIKIVDGIVRRGQ